MLIKSNSIVKKLQNCNIGSFVRFRSGASDVTAIVLTKYESASELEAIVLKDNNIPLPCISHFDENPFCLCYDSWILEIDGDVLPSSSEDRVSFAAVGTISRTDEDECLILSANGKSNDKVDLVDLGSMKRKQRDRARGIPVLTWRIWANEDHRHSEGAKPLFAFPSAPEMRVR